MFLCKAKLVREVHIQSCAGISVWISAFRIFYIHTAGQSTTTTLSTLVASFSPANQDNLILMKPLTIWKQNSLTRHNKAVTTFTLQGFPSYKHPLHPPRPSSIQLFLCWFPVSDKPQGSGRRLCLHLTGKGCTAASCLCLALATRLTFEPENQQLHGRSAETIQCLYETHLLSSSRPASSSHVQPSVSIIRQYYYHLIKIFLPQFSLKTTITSL